MSCLIYEADYLLTSYGVINETYAVDISQDLLTHIIFHKDFMDYFVKNLYLFYFSKIFHTILFNLNEIFFFQKNVKIIN